MDKHDQEQTDKEMLDRLRAQGVHAFGVVHGDGTQAWRGMNMTDKEAAEQREQEQLGQGSASPHEYAWALKEEVRLTLIRKDKTALVDQVLVERMHCPAPHPVYLRALVLTFLLGGEILINGKYVDLGDDVPAWCGLGDSIIQETNILGDSVIIRAGE